MSIESTKLTYMSIISSFIDISTKRVDGMNIRRKGHGVIVND